MTDPVQPLRYAIIGTGMMGVEHIENLNALDGAVVTAIADPYEPSRQAAVASAVAPNPIRVFDNHLDLIAADGAEPGGLCDVYEIVTPNHTHASVVADVMTTAKPFLLEKPMAITIAECEDLVARAEHYPSPIWIGLEYRYMAPVQRLLAELAAGTIGDVRMIAMREHRFPFLPKVDQWNRFSANTGGTLVEKCCHFFDLMNLIAGARPTKVYASGAQDVNDLDETDEAGPCDVIDNALVIVDYANGVRGSLDLCMFAEASRNQEEISVVGDAGKLEALIPDDIVRLGLRAEHRLGQVKEEHVISEAPYAGQHHGSSFVEHQRFADVIRSGGSLQPEVDVVDGLWSVAVGVAAHRSIDIGRAVMLDEVFDQVFDEGLDDVRR